MRTQSIGLLWRGGLALFLVVAVVLVVFFRATGGSDSKRYQELQQFAGRWSNSQAKVNYLFTGTSPTRSLVSRWTLYWQPPNWRLDFSGKQNDQMIEGNLIAGGDVSYVCIPSADGGQCTAYPPDRINLPIFSPFLSSFLKPDSIAGHVHAREGSSVRRSTRTIVGEKASCFTTLIFNRDEKLQQDEWCFASDGILLRLHTALGEGEDKGESKLEAREVVRSVAAEAFRPTFPIKPSP